MEHAHTQHHTTVLLDLLALAVLLTPIVITALPVAVRRMFVRADHHAAAWYKETL